jgi:hypothetical protein
MRELDRSCWRRGAKEAGKSNRRGRAGNDAVPDIHDWSPVGPCAGQGRNAKS